jgi:hypothetical protein
MGPFLSLVNPKKLFLIIVTDRRSAFSTGIVKAEVLLLFLVSNRSPVILT